MSWSLRIYSADGSSHLASYTETTDPNPVVGGFAWSRSGYGKSLQLNFNAVGPELTYQPRSWVKLVANGITVFCGVLWRVGTDSQSERSTVCESFEKLFAEVSVDMQVNTAAAAWTAARLKLPSSITSPVSLPATAPLEIKSGRYQLAKILSEIAIAIGYDWSVTSPTTGAGASWAFSWLQSATTQTLTANEMIFDDLSFDEYVAAARINIKVDNLEIPNEQFSDDAKKWRGIEQSYYLDGSGLESNLETVTINPSGNTIYPTTYDLYSTTWTNGLGATLLRDSNLNTSVTLGIGNKLRVSASAATKMIVAARFWIAAVSGGTYLHLTREPSDTSVTANSIRFYADATQRHFILPVLGRLGATTKLIFDLTGSTNGVRLSELLLVELPVSFFASKISRYRSDKNGGFSANATVDGIVAPTPRVALGYGNKTYNGVAPIWRYQHTNEATLTNIELGQVHRSRDAEAILRQHRRY